MLLRNLTLSDMPPGGSTYGADRAKACIEMVGIANDDPELSKPYMGAVANSVSPRTWDTKMTGGLLEYAKHGQPVVASPAVMAAASGPATLAGAMALANAEILAGVTMTQLANPGTPVVYGLPSSNVDVRYGSFAIGSPEGSLFVSFAGQMARHYGIPSRAGGGLTDAKTMDDQQGTEAMLQLMTTMLSGVNYVLHAAGVLDSYSTASPEKFVLDCDRIRYVERMREGFELSEETFALDLIREVEPGDHFLNKRHTLDHCKTEFLIPEIYDRDSYDNWEGDGGKSAYELAHERVGDLVDAYERPPMDADVEADLKRYAAEKRDEILG
jgi:trimethylamine--corrinoid protein Co-methyltransferase